MTQVLLVDDEAEIRASIKESLELAGLTVTDQPSAIEALEYLADNPPEIIISDVRMPDMDGLEFQRKVKMIDPDLPIVLITGHGHVRMAIKAIRDGAYDFLEKPFRPETLITVVKRALEKRELTLDNRKLRDQLSQATDLERIFIGVSSSVVALRERIKRYAQADIDVLIYGETGTGKELVARCLHDLGPRGNENFVPFYCATLSGKLSTSNTLSKAKGTFARGQAPRVGKFEYADKGVIFLDDVDCMSLEMQAELLRILQDRKIAELGSDKEKVIDIRVFSTSKTSLGKASDEGAFRSDLFFKLNVVNLHIPPLRDRIEDAPLLFQHFVNQHIQETGEDAPAMTAAVYDQLMSYHWPGNVRELQNNARRFALGFNPRIGDVEHSNSTADESLSRRVALYEQQIIRNTIDNFDGNVTKAAKFLSISRRTLYNKLGREHDDN